MAAPRLFKTEGIVLKADPYGEADLLVTLATQDGSKLRAMAWGARKMNSRKMGHLDTLNRVDLDLYRGPSMYSIRQVLNLESFVLLKSRLDATARAFYSRGACRRIRRRSQSQSAALRSLPGYPASRPGSPGRQ